MRIGIGVFVLACLTFATALAEDGPAPFASFDKAGPEELNDPHDLAFGPDGRLYVADKFGHRIAVVDPDTLEVVESLSAGKLPGAHDISFGPEGEVAVAVTGLGSVFVFSSVETLDIAPRTMLAAPGTEGALAHSNGRIYAMAGGTGLLIAYENGGAVASVGSHPGAHDVAEGPDGSVWVADNFNRRLVRYSPDLEKLQTVEGPQFGFYGPRYLDIDGFGRLVVADQDAHRILLIDPDVDGGAVLLGVLGTGKPGKGPNLFDDPEGVAIRGNDYYFSDSDNNRIVRYTVAIN
ncbi:NHL repeat-containing protein [uncultured Roseibium sp.]|uniref:NHL repeat-containing protein n=1 Tax=uncultured Roseibium sp. TaxID=1936171 RepID=UPI00261B4CD3|nr:NHL repeat-containing protein [uncultured Roseibium sp.]